MKVTESYGFEVVAETRYSTNPKAKKASANALGLLLRKTSSD
jgi:hypothetical protein